jgi:hypothetical protein
MEFTDALADRKPVHSVPDRVFWLPGQALSRRARKSVFFCSSSSLTSGLPCLDRSGKRPHRDSDTI